VSGAISLTAILTNILTFLTGIAGILAIIMLIIGAIMYLSAAGDEDRIDTGKKIVKFSIIGIIIAFSALLLVKQIASLFIV
jgi:type IV secretory pathway VirB2 component (pilin)